MRASPDSAAVQLAHRAGVRIIATAASNDVAFLRDLGASTVIDFQTQRFEERVRDVDAVIDLVGGDTQTRSFQVLRRGGKLMPCKKRSRNPKYPQQVSLGDGRRSAAYAM